MRLFSSKKATQLVIVSVIFLASFLGLSSRTHAYCNVATKACEGGYSNCTTDPSSFYNPNASSQQCQSMCLVCDDMVGNGTDSVNGTFCQFDYGTVSGPFYVDNGSPQPDGTCAPVNNPPGTTTNTTYFTLTAIPLTQTVNAGSNYSYSLTITESGALLPVTGTFSALSAPAGGSFTSSNWSVTSANPSFTTIYSGPAGSTSATYNITFNAVPNLFGSGVLPVTVELKVAAYAWHTTQGTCTVACGGGTQHNTVTCQDSFGATVNENNCTGTKPVQDISCNTQSCGAPACNNNSDCNDSNSCTTDTCNNPGATNAFCNHTSSGTHLSCTGTNTCSAIANSASSCTNSCATGAECGGGCVANVGQSCDTACTTGQKIQCDGSCAGGSVNPGTHSICTAAYTCSPVANTASTCTNLCNSNSPDCGTLNTNYCGSDNGGTFSSPSYPTNLCSGGATPDSTPSGAGPWSWNCTGANNTSPCHADYVVGATPPSVSLWLWPTDTTSLGNPSPPLLQWLISNATSCDDPLGTMPGGSWSSANSGQISAGSVTGETHYTIHCTGPGGEASASTILHFINNGHPQAGSVNATSMCPTPGVRISWTADPNAAAGIIYYVNRSPHSGVGAVTQFNTTSLSYDDTTGTLNTMYDYTVEATQGDGTATPANTNASGGIAKTACGGGGPTGPNPPINPGGNNSATSGSVSCGTVNLQWQDDSTDEDGFKVYRNTVNNSGTSVLLASPPLIGSNPILTTSKAAKGKVYSVNIQLDNDTTPYYYWVTSYNGTGQSVYVSFGTVTNFACSASLINSDKDITAINSVNQGVAQACNKQTDPLPPTTGLLKIGDMISFKINLCNSAPFGSAAATNVTIVDNMNNLSKPSGGWNLKYYNGVSTVSLTDRTASQASNCPSPVLSSGEYAVCGTSPNQQIYVSLTNAANNVPPQTAPPTANYQIRYLTMDALVNLPSTSVLYGRFQNSALVSYDTGGTPPKGFKTVNTPLILFYNGADVPTRNETP